MLIKGKYEVELFLICLFLEIAQVVVSNGGDILWLHVSQVNCSNPPVIDVLVAFLSDTSNQGSIENSFSITRISSG